MLVISWWMNLFTYSHLQLPNVYIGLLAHSDSDLFGLVIE